MNFFIQMKESVIDTKFYRQIKNNKFGKSFIYLLLLCFVIYCMYATIAYMGMQSWVNEFTNQLTHNVPDFALENGEFKFQGKSPFVLNGSSEEVLIIDTSGQTKVNALDNSVAGILITKDSIVVKQNSELKKLDLAETKGMVFTKADLLAFLPKMKWVIIIGIALGFVLVLCWKLLNAVLLTLLGMILNESIKTDLKFSNILNISIYALTLPLLLELAIYLSGIPIPFFFVIYWFISIAYLIMAIKGYKEDTDSNKREDQDIYMA